jgi:tetratricopeptide (TPR) repeat protein
VTRRSDPSGATAAPSQPFASTLSRYADGLVEATWLAAVACVPLLANRYSIRSFEPDKLALLRALALIALAAWLLKALGQAGGPPEPLDHSRRPARLGTWVLLASGGLAVANLAATLGSVAPAVSFWGSYERLQGACTMLAYLALFAAMVANLRDQDQADRLVGTIVAASLPVAVYGIAQRLGLDPVPTDRAAYLGTARVTSTLGNPVFLGAYLAMVWPLTLARIMETTVLSRSFRDRHVSGRTKTILFVLTAAMQLIAVVFAESRGPFLGLVVGSIGLLLIVAVLRRARRLVLWGIAAILGGALLLGLLAAAGGPLRGLPLVSRLTEVSDPSRGTLRYRVEVWEVAPRLLTAREPFHYPDGSADPWHRLRLLIGYGPETLPFVIRRLIRSPSDLTPDRFHNEIWDTLASTGVVGLAATLTLTLGLLYAALRRLRLVTGPRQRAWFWVCTLGGGVGGGLLAASRYGPATSAAGFQLGLVAGQLVYLSVYALARPELAAPDPLDRNDLLVAALWAALIGHAVELSFSFLVAATAILFWTYAALLHRTGASGNSDPVPPDGDKQPPARPSPSTAVTRTSRRHRRPPVARPAMAESPVWWRPVLQHGAILTIIMVTLGFLLLGTVKPSSFAGVLGSAFTTPQPESWPPVVLALGLVGVWTGAAAILALSTTPGGSRPAPARSLGGILLVSGVLGALYWTWLAADLAALSRQLLVDGPSALANAEGYVRVVTTYHICLLALLVGFAAARPAPRSAMPSRPTALGVIAAPLALGVALVAAWFVALRPIQADTIAARAITMHRGQLWDGATLTFRRAIELAPDVERYRVQLGKVYFEQSQLAVSAGQREALLGQAAQAWKDLQALGPLYWSYAPLATLYTTWGFQTSDAERRLELARRAAAQYARAVVLGPNDPNLWHDWAYLEMSLLKNPEEARVKALRALELNPQYEATLALMGNYESDRWRERPDTEDGRQALRRAVAYYERAAQVAKDKYVYLMAVAEAQAQLGDREHAIANYVSARPLASQADVWKVDESLARLYASTGDKNLAVRHATQALESAPSEARTRLETLRTQLRRAQ